MTASAHPPPDAPVGRRRAGTVAVVTGGSRGIGRAFAVEAARRGYDVVVGYRSRSSDADEVVGEVRAMGRDAWAVGGDVADRHVVDEIAATARRGGEVGVLVNNAAVNRAGPFDAVTEADWDEVLAVDLGAPMWLIKALASDLAAAQGSVLNVSSTGGVVGSVHSLPYSAAKAGLLGLTKTIARMLAPDVRVNAICPGLTETEMAGTLTPEQATRVLAETPIPRLADPAEIAAAGLDVCEWTYCTGQTIVLDGGRVTL